jgi:hypothetical protein
VDHDLNKIRKRNMQLHEIYRQVLIIEALAHANKRLKRGRNGPLESIHEAVRLLSHCLEQDGKNIHFEEKEGLYEFAHKYRLPIFKNFSYKTWHRRLVLMYYTLITPRSFRRNLYDGIPMQRLYPGLSRRTRRALIRKDLERLRLSFPRLEPLLKRQEWPAPNLTFLTGEQVFLENKECWTFYQGSSDHLELGIG